MYEIDLEPGDTANFTSYDASINTFNVYGDKTKDNDEGGHTIIINVRIFNETFSMTQSETFILTVWKPKQITPASCVVSLDLLRNGTNIVDVSAKFYDLRPNSSYTISMIDSKAPNCTGNKLMDMGTVFSDSFGLGFI